MNEIWPFLLGLIPSIITSSVVFYMQRAQKKRDEYDAAVKLLGVKPKLDELL